MSRRHLCNIETELLYCRSAAVLDTHPARGSSFETLLIDQVISAYRRVAPGSQPYFWRTAQGDEVDLLARPRDLVRL
jgi:hypothetical protein